MLADFIADLNEVEEKYRSLYEKQEDGTYKLDEKLKVDVSGLKNNNVALKNEKLKLQQKLKEFEEAEKQKKEQELLDKQKYEELLASKEATFQAQLTEKTTKLEALKNSLISSNVNQMVTQLATSLAGENALLLEPHIKARVKAELSDEGQVNITFLNTEGGAINQDALLQEFKGNPVFKTVIKGRNSTGGGANGGAEGAGDAGEWAKYFDENSDDYSPSKQYELQQSNPQLHDSLFAKYLQGKY